MSIRHLVVVAFVRGIGLHQKMSFTCVEEQRYKEVDEPNTF